MQYIIINYHNGGVLDRPTFSHCAIKQYSHYNHAIL